MILDKIKQFWALAEQMDAAGRASLNMMMPIQFDRIKNEIRGGKWSVLTFAAHEAQTASYGLRILPYLSSEKWPYVGTMPYLESSLDYPSMIDEIQWSHIFTMAHNIKYCENYLKKWDKLYADLLPVYKLFGGKDDLAVLKEFVHNKENWPTAELLSSEEKDELYRKNSLKMDDSAERRYLYNLLDQLKSNRKFIPEFPDIDLGIYDDWIMSMIANRAYFESDLIVDQRLFLLATMYSHGFDTQSQGTSYSDKSSASKTSSNVFSPIETLFQIEEFEIGVISEEVKAMPEFHIAQAMNEQGAGYNGIAHMEVAAIMDEQYNDPKKAWKYLVSAGYWVGKNMPEAQGTVLNAAIYLCEKHNWLEALEVLKYNKDLLES